MDIRTAIELQSEEINWLLPQPENDLEETKSGRWGIVRRIPLYVIDGYNAKEFLAHEWAKMHQQAMIYISKQIVGRDNYLVFKLYPMIQNNHFDNPEISLELSWDIFIAPTRNIVIPEFVYVNGYAMEWKCGHCESPNEMSERHCTKCGAPRATLIQEMRNSTGEAVWSHL